MKLLKRECPSCKETFTFVYTPFIRHERTYCTRKCKDKARRDKENPNRRRYTGVSVEDRKKYMREYMRTYKRKLLNNPKG